MNQLITGLLLATLASLSLAASAGDRPRTLSTTGLGEVSVAADQAVVHTQAQTTHRSASDAKLEVDRRVNTLLDKLAALGIDKEDIVASTLRLQPNFDYEDRKPIFTGYNATRDVVVTLRKLDGLNAVLDAAVDSGINQISQIALESSEADKHRDAARRQAIDDSKAKAQTLATAYGAELGPIHSINYQSSQPMARPKTEMAVMRMAADGFAGSGQYLHDEITFNDSVQVVFELIVPH
ncbi:MAG: SIMPL domain-containing protein [Porticoccaceae bacterium]|jgi:uncharacterized protein YggE